MSSCPSTPISFNDDDFNVLPAGGHEVEGVLRLALPSQNSVVCFGRFTEDLDQLRPDLVRLGTKVSDLHPSCIGFRILLRNAKSKSQAKGIHDELYHVVSCRFWPQAGAISHHVATLDDLQELIRDLDISRPCIPSTVHRLDFTNLDNAFEITHHGEEPDIYQTIIAQRLGELRSLNRCKNVSVFFKSDDVLLFQLDQTIQRGCIGSVSQAWSDSLPANAVAPWPNDNQTRMVAGSADLVNVLNRAMRENLLDDAAVTALNGRVKARQFKAFLQQTYPTIKRESKHKLFPVMLNVTHGTCLELPFGASMFNRENTYATINALHKMIEFGLPPSDIGIIALYPSQTDVYHRILALCHERRPMRGYNHVRINVLDGWIGKEIEYAVVDFVRTPNASGNLGLLSQTRRLKAALTLHRNGLILIGDRRCTVNAQGKVTSTKLEKIFVWLEENGRVIDIGAEDVPVSSTVPGSTARREQTQSISVVPAHHPSADSAGSIDSMARSYVGIPELEKDRNKVDGGTTKGLRTGHSSILNSHLTSNDHMGAFYPDTFATNTRASDERSGQNLGLAYTGTVPAQKVKASESFARQGLFGPGTLLAGEEKCDRTSRTNRTASPDNASAFRHIEERTRAMDGDGFASNGSSIRRPKSPRNRVLPHELYSARSLASPAQVAPATNKENMTPQPSGRPGLERKLTFGEVEGNSNLSNPMKQGPPAPGPITLQHLQSMHTALAQRSNNANSQPIISPTSTYNYNPSPMHSQHQPPRAPQPPQPPPTLQVGFRSHYTPKCKAIRSIFDSFHTPQSSAPLPNEDRLFRRLGEAFIGEDAKAFDLAYLELLRLAQGLQLGEGSGSS